MLLPIYSYPILDSNPGPCPPRKKYDDNNTIFQFCFLFIFVPPKWWKKNGCEKDKKHTRIRKKKKINEEELFLFCFRLIVWRIKLSFYLTLYCISSFQVFVYWNSRLKNRLVICCWLIVRLNYGILRDINTKGILENQKLFDVLDSFRDFKSDF